MEAIEISASGMTKEVLNWRWGRRGRGVGDLSGGRLVDVKMRPPMAYISDPTFWKFIIQTLV